MYRTGSHCAHQQSVLSDLRCLQRARNVHVMVAMSQTQKYKVICATPTTHPAFLRLHSISHAAETVAKTRHARMWHKFARVRCTSRQCTETDGIIFPSFPHPKGHVESITVGRPSLGTVMFVSKAPRLSDDLGCASVGVT